MRKTMLLLCSLGATLAAPCGAQDQGLTAPGGGLGGPTWQARFEADALPLLAYRGIAAPLQAGNQQTLRLLGDYRLDTLRLGQTGGLRLTGGLLLQWRQTGSSPATDLRGTLPYAGVGYSSGDARGQWGFSADLGLAAPGLGGLRAERPLGSGSTDSGTRLLPMLRLGMNLAF